MGKHYCRKGGAPIGVMDVPPYVDPGSIVQNDDRLSWEEPTYGRVRMLFRCCATALVQFIGDSWDGTTTTRAIALDKLSRVPDGVLVTVPCIGADWSATLDCGHINGEGCDCDTIALEAGWDVRADQPPTPVTLTIVGEHEYPFSARDADNVVTLFETEPFYRDRYIVERVWEPVAFQVIIRERNGGPSRYATPLMNFHVALI